MGCQSDELSIEEMIDLSQKKEPTLVGDPPSSQGQEPTHGEQDLGSDGSDVDGETSLNCHLRTYPEFL